ncbi:MAG: thioredoxin family protein [Candidatus Ranarchaeia archaeon]|jgi:hypothetical protein
MVIYVEAMGPNPPCHRCKDTLANAQEAGKQAIKEGLAVEVVHKYVSDREILQKYGNLVTPALAINNKVKVMGRIPTTEEILTLIKKV